MDKLIVKHYYSDSNNEFISDISFDIFDDYRQMVEVLSEHYMLLSYRNGLTFHDSNVLVYRCGSISSLGEFTIYANPLPIYFKEIVEELYKND